VVKVDHIDLIKGMTSINYRMKKRQMFQNISERQLVLRLNKLFVTD
jgi:hypothetical protein